MSIRTDHDAPPAATSVAQPLVDVPGARRRTAAEEARTLIKASTIGTLATISADGGPWASLVAYGQIEDGSQMLLVSTLAEHGATFPARAERACASPSAPTARTS